jgi:hypothetical protein
LGTWFALTLLVASMYVLEDKRNFVHSQSLPQAVSLGFNEKTTLDENI